MAASAKEKAYNLKDSYVAGLIEGGATAPAPNMPTQDMGEQASTIYDVGTGRIFETNDGRPKLVTTDSNTGYASVVHNSSSANPISKYDVNPKIQARNENSSGYKEAPKTGFMGSGGYATNLTGSRPMSEDVYSNMKWVLQGGGRGGAGAERRQLNSHERQIISGNLHGYHDVTGR